MQRKQEKKMSGKKKAFRAEKNNSELKEKGHEPSRAELKISQLELWLEPARLGPTFHFIKQVIQNSVDVSQKRIVSAETIRGNTVSRT